MNTIGSHGFHHIAVAAGDFERSAAFYRDGLGFEQLMAWGDHGNRAAMFDAGNGGRIELFERPEHGRSNHPRMWRFHRSRCTR